MDIMEYLLLEMACIMCSKNGINRAQTIREVDEINVSITDSEEEMLRCCTLENFREVKEYYQERLLNGFKSGLFGVQMQDLLDYTEELIAKKKERER